MADVIPRKAFFNTTLESGKTYRVAFETEFTQAGFSSSLESWAYYVWSPTDWLLRSFVVPGYNSTFWDMYNPPTGTNEDVAPHWCPYPNKLNEAISSGPNIYWDGGMRLEFVATESGVWVFEFESYCDDGILTSPNFGFIIYEVGAEPPTPEVLPVGTKKIVYIEPDAINDNKISILEKIRRLTELQDPDLMDIDHLQYFANNLGYNVDINRGEMGNLASIDTSGTCPDINTNKYLRFAIRNLPLWYRIKTTQNAIKIMLYSFGIIGDISQYYTNNYLPTSDGGRWEVGDVNQRTYSISAVPNDFYPTPHFIVWVNLDISNSNLSWEYDKRAAIISSIESIRPVNSVFRKLGGTSVISKQIGITCAVRFHSQYKKLPAINNQMPWYP